jgi:glycosyltransferase involved in cell wall biosynthesis
MTSIDKDVVKIPDDYKAPKSSRIAALIMVKNEAEHILTTLKSLKGIISHLIVLDTGSTDRTLEVMSEWARENGVPIFPKMSTFIDFSKSRNKLFEWADSLGTTPEGEHDFELMLDCGDELRGGEYLQVICSYLLTLPHKVFMLRQQWLHGDTITRYLNSRLAKSNHMWRYKKRVHEYLAAPEGEENYRPIIEDKITLYQDRNNGDTKTQKRFTRDKELLLADVAEFNDPRDLFYLGQTLGCLNEIDEAYKIYQRRADIIDGFWEERFHSYLRSAEISLTKGDEDLAISNYLKALLIDFRAEPLVGLGRIYRRRGDLATIKNEPEKFRIAYLFFSLACSLDYPTQSVLFISDIDYSYERWAQLSIMAYYVDKFEEGLKALDIAEKTGRDPEMHKKNREAYRQKLASGAKEVDKFTVEEIPAEMEEIYEGFLSEFFLSIKDENIDHGLVSLMNAFEFSNYYRPLLILGSYARDINAFPFSYHFLKLIERFETPTYLKTKQQRLGYEYHRHHLMGIVAYYMEKFEDGKNACIQAVKKGVNIMQDRENLKMYLSREKSQLEEFKREDERRRSEERVKHSLKGEDTYKTNVSSAERLIVDAPKAAKATSETRDVFVSRVAAELMAANPKMGLSQATTRARLMWKVQK